MALGAPRFFLRPDETVQAEAGIRARWWLRNLVVLVAVQVPLVVVILMVDAFRPGGIASAEMAALWTLYALGMGLLAAALLVASWRRVVTTEYVVTNETAYTRRGKILLHVRAVPLDKITDIHAHKGILGRAIGYSDLVVRTSGGHLQFIGLADAFKLRETLHDQRRAFIQRLLEESGRGARRLDAADLDARHKARCPNCASVFAAPAMRPVDVTCPDCGLEGTLFAEASS